MKSSGVHGEKSVTAAATRSASGGSRSPSGAVADLVVVLRADDEPARIVAVALEVVRRARVTEPYSA